MGRWGLGPVFVYEWLAASRRWQMYAVRSLFVLSLLAAFCVVWRSHVGGRPFLTYRELAAAGEQFFYAIAGTQLALVMLAAPAATAGAVCQDRERGALAHLLMTDLSDTEIVLGKLAGRLLPVLGLLLGGLPVLFLVALLGGIDFEALLGASVVTLGVALLGCSLSLVLSVWARRTHEVLLVTYAAWGVVLLAYPVSATFISSVMTPRELKLINPFWLAFSPYTDPGGTSWSDFGIFLGGSAGLSAAFLVLGVATLRPLFTRQTARPARARRHRPGRVHGQGKGGWFRRPSLDGNPVLWREYHRRRPSRWVRAVQWLYTLGAIGFSAWAVWLVMFERNPERTAAWVNGLQVSVGLLLASAAAVTPLAEERARGSMELLLTTPLPTESIVWGKWWGTYRKVARLAVLPGLVGCALAVRYGTWVAAPILVGVILAYGAAVTSMGLALATWVRRMGWAVGVSVVIYVLVTVGWLAAMGLLSHQNEGLAQASPFFGVGQLTFVMGEHKYHYWESVFWDVGWTVAYAFVAALLLGATVSTFDACLGRARQRFAEEHVPGPPAP